ncbi:MAG: MATE family efflux transporter [Treponema sp.]|jgi:putative MATE family efflux protein|nr:MATE family efflux transporter [Treponema sp.]
MVQASGLEKYNYIVNGSVSPVKAIFIISWPVLVEQILTTFVNYADTAMVGKLGAYATAAVSISNPVFMMVNGLTLALGVGITTLLAQSVGANDPETAKSLIRHAVLLMIWVGIPVSVISGTLSRLIPLWMGAEADVLDHATVYNIITSFGRPFVIGLMIAGSAFRGCGDTRTPMVITLGMNCVNILGNYFLINPSHELSLYRFRLPLPGAGWGVAGAAAATSLSQVLACLALVLILFKRSGPFRISIHDSFRLNRRLIRPVMKISLPTMLERVCISISQIVVTASIASLGTAVVAANTLYLTAESMSFMPALAFMTGITTVVGQCLGARKIKLAERYIYITMAFSALLLSFIAALLFIFARPILRFFTPDEQVIAIAQTCLRIVAFLQPIQVQAWVLAGALRGAGDTRWSFYITALCSWLIRALGAVLVIRVFGFGLREAVFCMFADSTVRSLLLFMRMKTGKWKKRFADL